MLVKERYDQAIEDFLKRWEEGKSTDWRSLTVKNKIAYVRACLQWSGLPKQQVKCKHYIIDGKQVKNHIDLYCLLGEVFSGERGYFGQDLHGFKDCFNEIHLCEPHKSVVEPNTTVFIINQSKLEKALNKQSKEYFAHFLKILESCGFVVKLIY